MESEEAVVIRLQSLSSSGQQQKMLLLIVYMAHNSVDNCTVYTSKSPVHTVHNRYHALAIVQNKLFCLGKWSFGLAK